MDKSLYNPQLTLYNMPDAIEYIKILQDQGVSAFDPVKFYNEAQKKQPEENLNMTKKERKKNNKLKISKGAQKIIENNIKNRENKLKNDEDAKIDNFLKECKDINSIKNLINKMKTVYGRVKVKALLLNNCIINNLILESHLLFFSLKNEDENIELKDLVQKSILKYKNLYKERDLIEIQMTELSSYLNPLNPLNYQKKKLDDWQIEVFKLTEKKEDILIVAPTSAGKTVCSTYCTIVGKKTLFVVPSDELARQVAGIFRNMPNIMIGIITNKEYYLDTNINVIIGTPKKLEEYLTFHLYEDKCNFDYVIYDEIQMLNSEEGAAFENIIKLLNIPSLFLSATIDDPYELKKWLELIRGKNINLIKYNKRFIIQQRYLWQDNVLRYLHPMSCINLEYIKSNEFLNSGLSFTPRDTYDLYKVIKDNIEDINKIKPHNILNKNKWDSIDLNDTAIIENVIKNYLSDLAKTNPEIVEKILKNYNVKEVNDGTIDIISLIKILISNDMCPAIFFKLDAFKCRTIFKYIVADLEKQQNNKYPYHYDDMTLQYDTLRDLNEDWSIQKEKLSIPKNMDPEIFKENVKKKLGEKYLNIFKKKYTQIIKNRIQKINDSDIEDKTKDFYSKYYNDELNKILLQSELIYVDKNMPHPEFTFNYMGIDSNTMRGIKCELKKTLGYDIKYTHPIMIGIERGIVPYFRDMETPFQRIVQRLFALKKIPIIISDQSLGYGINMPIRTVVMLGKNNEIEKIDPLIANQMSGRSGRRGIDRKGNIVYAGVNWKSILRGSYPKLTGENPISMTLPLPLYFKKIKENDVNRLLLKTLYQFKNNLNEDNKKTILKIISENKYLENEFNSELIWSCRYFDKNYKYLPNILNILKKNISYITHYDVFSYFVCLFDKNISYDENVKFIDFDTSTLYSSKELLSVYKENKIYNNDSSQNIINRLKTIASALSAIHIVISKNDEYKKLKKLFQEVFENIKNLASKYQF